MTFAIVHTSAASRAAPPAPEAIAPPPAAAPTPAPPAAKLTRKVSAKATVMVPESAERWADVAVQVGEFHKASERFVAFTRVEAGRSLLSGVAACLPWVAGLAALVTANGVGVAACLGWAGAQRSLRRSKDLHDPVSATQIAKLQEALTAAQASATDNPLKQAALRHVVINHLTAALAQRGLCVEGELLLQDLTYTATFNDPVDAAGKRAADAAKVLMTPEGYSPKFGDVEPFEAVALQKHYPQSENSRQAYAVHWLAENAQEKIDRAVGVEVQRLLDQKLTKQNEG